MQRLAALLFLAVLAVSLASCGGGSGSSSSSTPTSVTLAVNSKNVTSVTLNFGDVVQIVPTFVNSSGTTVYPSSVAYVSDNTSMVTVNSSGYVCAGTWDSKDTAVCHPATTSGTATVTVTGGGISGTLKVFVHPKVDRIAISGSIDVANCISMAATAPDNTAKLSAKAFRKVGEDSKTGEIIWDEITSIVGPFTWTAPDGTATVDSSGKCSTDNTCVLTASSPGQTRVYASLATSGTSVSSYPGTFTTCPVKSISVHTPSATDTAVTLDPAGTQTLAMDMVDSKGNTLTTITPQYSLTQPVVAAVSSSTVTAPVLTASSPGKTSIVASCVPSNGCNTNLWPVYGNIFNATVNKGSTATTTTVYVASTSGKSLIPVDTSTNTAGTAITLPDTPNSIAMDKSGTTVYLGSNSGLMQVNTTSNTVSTLASAVGRVISVSPNGASVLVFNPPVSAQGTATLHTVSIGETTSVTPMTIVNAGATAKAAWAPDSSVGYIVTGGKLLIRSSSGTTRTLDVGEVNDLDFLTQGSFAYFATADVSVRATCNNEVVDTQSVGGSPAIVRSLPNASAVLAFYPNDLSTATTRYLRSIAVSTNGAGCPPVVTNTPASSPVLLGSFKPGQVVLTPNSSKVFVTATDNPAVISYDVATGQATAITLTGTGVTGALGAGVTVDSTTLYVGAAGTNDLHIINTSTNADTQQIAIGFQPDLVAVRPR